MADYIDLAEAIKALRRSGEACKDGAEAATVVFDEMAFECLALFWARVNCPEWVYISVHHRKRRIRKKYHDRILREYERRNQHG